MEPKRVSTCEWYWWCLEARSWFWFSLMVMIWRLLPLRSGPSLCWDILELCVTTAIIVFLRIYHVFLCIHKYSYFTIQQFYLSVKKTLPVGKLLQAGRSSRQRRVNLCGQFFTIGGAADLSTSVKRLTEREECNMSWHHHSHTENNQLRLPSVECCQGGREGRGWSRGGGWAGRSKQRAVGWKPAGCSTIFDLM